MWWVIGVYHHHHLLLIPPSDDPKCVLNSRFVLHKSSQINENPKTKNWHVPHCDKVNGPCQQILPSLKWEIHTQSYKLCFQFIAKFDTFRIFVTHFERASREDFWMSPLRYLSRFSYSSSHRQIMMFCKMKMCFKMYQFNQKTRLGSRHKLEHQIRLCSAYFTFCPIKWESPHQINPNLNSQSEGWLDGNKSPMNKHKIGTHFSPNWWLWRIRCLFCLINNEDVTWCCMYTHQRWTMRNCCLFVCHSSGDMVSEKANFCEMKIIRNMRIRLRVTFGSWIVNILIPKSKPSWWIGRGKMISGEIFSY